MTCRYWLLKSEPRSFSIQALQASPQQTTCWDGVRNYQARNLLRDALQVGDGVLFYHSCTAPVGIAGLARVQRAGYADATQFVPESRYYDALAQPDKPRWYCVDITWRTTFKQVLTLQALRTHPGLVGMEVLRRGSRLSVQPVTAAQWQIIGAWAAA